MATKKKKAIPELWVVFDTNAVYTGSASYLLRKEVVDTINDNSAHPDLKIRWILPAVVRHERQYQMIRQARGFLPTVEKLERLLGHNLNIPPDILDRRVTEAAQRSIDGLKLEIEDLDVGKPDWQRIILDAAYRRPPFDSGEAERGFRDAIVLETFAQLVARAPQNPKSCRLALVTGDKLLSEAAATRTSGAANVRLFGTVEELRGLINTLVSEVDEEFVKALMPQASKLFFVLKEEDTLYYAEKVAGTIGSRLKADIGALPNGADRYEITKYVIAQPQFVRKERQQIRWSSRVEAKLDAIKSASGVGTTVFDPVASTINLGLNPSASVPTGITIDSGSEWPTYLFKHSNMLMTSNLFAPASTPQVAFAGRAAYDVFWSSTISTARRLTRPQIETIELVELVWALG